MQDNALNNCDGWVKFCLTLKLVVDCILLSPGFGSPWPIVGIIIINNCYHSLLNFDCFPLTN